MRRRDQGGARTTRPTGESRAADVRRPGGSGSEGRSGLLALSAARKLSERPDKSVFTGADPGANPLLGDRRAASLLALVEKEAIHRLLEFTPTFGSGRAVSLLRGASLFLPNLSLGPWRPHSSTRLPTRSTGDPKISRVSSGDSVQGRYGLREGSVRPTLWRRSHAPWRIDPGRSRRWSC